MTEFFYRAIEQPISTKEKKIIDHIDRSIQKAEKHHSKLTKAILNLPGFSSPKVRHFLNNLCTLNNTRYLEIGSWKGSTLISALYKNNRAIADAIAIDNWSEFNSPQLAFSLNCERFLPNSKLRFYSQDCFDSSAFSLFNEPITIYFYDGPHEEIHHEKAFTHFNSILDQQFITIIDDWNWDDVRRGTYRAFSQLKYTILYEKHLPSQFNADKENWWNGLYVALIRKS